MRYHRHRSDFRPVDTPSESTKAAFFGRNMEFDRILAAVEDFIRVNWRRAAFPKSGMPSVVVAKQGQEKKR